MMTLFHVAVLVAGAATLTSWIFRLADRLEGRR